MLIYHQKLLIFLTFIPFMLKRSLNFCLSLLLLTVILILFLAVSHVKQSASVFCSYYHQNHYLSLPSGVFLNSLKTVQFILFLKNKILIKKILITIILSNICLFCVKLTERMVKHRLMVHLSKIIFSILLTLLMLNHTQQKLHSSQSMTTSSELWVFNKLLDFSWSIFWLPLTILIILFFLSVSIKSWFDFSNTALSWIKLHLIHWSFYVNLDCTKSLVFQLFLYCT